MWYNTNIIAFVPVPVGQLAMIVQNEIGNSLGLSVRGSLGLVTVDLCELVDSKGLVVL